MLVLVRIFETIEDADVVLDDYDELSTIRAAQCSCTHSVVSATVSS